MGIEQSSSVIDALTIHGNDINDPLEISEHLNNYFTNIGERLSSTIPATNCNPMTHLTQNNYQSIFISPVTRIELYNCIQCVKDGSAGHDGLKPGILKEACQNYIEPLLHIINLSFSEGHVPKMISLFNRSSDKVCHANYSSFTSFSTNTPIHVRLLCVKVAQYSFGMLLLKFLVLIHHALHCRLLHVECSCIILYE